MIAETWEQFVHHQQRNEQTVIIYDLLSSYLAIEWNESLTDAKIWMKLENILSPIKGHLRCDSID